MMKRISTILVILLALLGPMNANAHSGRTDANGGHYNRRTGVYHYHNGGKSSPAKSSPKAKKVTYKIAVSNMPASMLIDESTQLEWTVDGDDLPLTWSSSNQAVLSVSKDGVLTAHAKGTAKIHATYSGSSKTWTVSVKPVLVSEIEVSPKQILLRIGDSASLSAEISPPDATDDSIEWTSANRKVATVDPSGAVTVVGAGTASITAKAKDGSKKADSASVIAVCDIPQEDFPIEKGSAPANVATIQALLIALGEPVGNADGAFGSKTQSALVGYQQRNDLEEGPCSYELYTHMLADVRRMLEE